MFFDLGRLLRQSLLGQSSYVRSCQVWPVGYSICNEGRLIDTNDTFGYRGVVSKQCS